MNRYLVAVTTPNYVAKCRSYFSSIPLVRSAQVRIILLDFTAETDEGGRIEDGLRSSMPYLEYRHLPLHPSNSNFMSQWGNWLDSLPEVGDDDLLAISDMDIQIQRDFTHTEWEELEGRLGDNQIGLYWNCGESDSLDAESKRINLSEQWITKYAPADGLSRLPCLNCGLMVARAGVFRRLRTVYEAHCAEFYEASSHRSRCQLLVNWCIWKMELEVAVLPAQFHQHGHMRNAEGDVMLPASARPEMRMGVLFAGGEPVIFRHNL